MGFEAGTLGWSGAALVLIVVRAGSVGDGDGPNALADSTRKERLSMCSGEESREL